MRYMIKGGVWKNSEDEILKAAVMKYGLNQWSRISSLLVRKSAKQCKARWYEWLDPSIKKTEWTREEEEKLLHLAKIFPHQWRTIAPIVGRTPAQCAEHYEKLLDQAQGKFETDENDPRKLKPGEIDPAPETRPARPDPIDMDEDEKEMLAEARVRLANTKGKKAKRKAREQMIEEARRLAAIQKKRELRAAGIEFEIKKKMKGVDYNAEVPFERAPLQLVYKTGPEEEPKPNLHLANISLQTLEGKRRDEEEEKLRKLDERRIKKLKERNLPQAVENITKLNNAIVNTKTKLVLPSPQLPDKELEQMGKMNSLQEQLAQDNQATRVLVGNYSQRAATPTPMRTPRVESSVMREAQNNIALLKTQTPLLGGENAPLYSLDKTGATPVTIQTQTPNIYGNEFVTPKPKMGMNASFQTPKPHSSVRETPRHDALRINEEFDQNWETMSQSGASVANYSTTEFDRESLLQLKQQIRSGLSSLPKPKNDYEIEAPELEALEPEPRKKRILDAEERDYLARKMEEERQERMRRLISQSVRKNLPRPYKINFNFVESYLDSVEEEDEYRRDAERMLAEEMLSMLANDSVRFPFKGVVHPREVPEMDFYDEDELMGASKLIQDEIAVIKKELGEPNPEVLSLIAEEIKNDIIFDENSKRFLDIESQGGDLTLQHLRRTFELQKEKLEKDSKRIESLQSKVSIILGGYPRKTNELGRSFNEALQEMGKSTIELEVFNKLYNQEKSIISSRIGELKIFYQQLLEREAELQKKHERLVRERDEALTEAPVVQFA